MSVYPSGLPKNTHRIIDRVIIATSTTQSNGIEIGGASSGQIFSPITGSIAFESSPDGNNWWPVYDAGTATTISATANRCYAIPSSAIQGKYMRVVVPAQGADLEIQFVLKGV